MRLYWFGRRKREGDQRLRGLRHRWEGWVLLLTIMPMVVGLLVSGVGTAGTTLLVFGGGCLGILVRLQWSRAQLLAQGIRVSPTQLPEVYEAVARCAQWAPLRHPVEVIVVQEEGLQAYTFGLGGTKTIVLSSALLAALSEEELTAVVAHEWGHLALGHTMMVSLFGALNPMQLLQDQVQALTSTVPMMGRSASGSSGAREGALRMVGMVVLLSLAPALFLGYRRLAEISADRFAVLVAGNAETPAMALARVALGEALASQVNQRELMAQAKQLEGSLFGFVLQALGSHPFVGSRLRAMHEWAASPEYDALLGAACVMAFPVGELPTLMTFKEGE